ncbi:MAG: dicarboxylate/amino acid:cation symporter [Acidimicrobiia bacterium]|nr:dicarboxylate/amino acid:cation symporter [Acidimicrobiia bacterium]
MKRPEWTLPALMLAGGVGGVTIGTAFGARWDDPALELLTVPVQLMGTVFLALLKAIMVPLIVTSVIMALGSFGTAANTARVAGLAVAYFLITTFMAVLTGLALVLAVHPGRPSAATLAAPPPLPAERSALQAIAEVISGMFPANLFSAAGADNVLGLLVISLIVGAALARMGDRAAPLTGAIGAANEALFTVVRWIVLLAPLGILGLVADRLGRAGGGAAAWEEVQRLGMYAVTVVAGLAIHAMVTLPLLLRTLARRNPFRYAAGMSEALVTALGTASSAATMGVTLRCAVERNQVSARAADFVIPIGTTINMDGTALYEAVAVVFIAQSLGIDLTGVQLVVVALTATLAAIGAAAIPEAGLITMVLVLTAVGLPAEGVGLLLVIDWILDRFRTSVNVWGDAVGAAIVDRHLPPAERPARG